MPDIDISDAAYRELERLAVAWECGLTEAADRLVIGVATAVRVRRPRPGVRAGGYPRRVRRYPHRRDLRRRVRRGDGVQRPVVRPDLHLAQRRPRAVVAMLIPDVSPGGNGWHFWTVTATGARLGTLRR